MHILLEISTYSILPHIHPNDPIQVSLTTSFSIQRIVDLVMDQPQKGIYEEISKLLEEEEEKRLKQEIKREKKKEERTSSIILFKLLLSNDNLNKLG